MRDFKNPSFFLELFIFYCKHDNFMLLIHFFGLLKEFYDKPYYYPILENYDPKISLFIKKQSSLCWCCISVFAGGGWWLLLLPFNGNQTRRSCICGAF